MIVKFKVDIIAVSFIMFLIAPSAISKTSIVNDDLEVMKIKKIEQAITQNNISLLEKELEVTLDISKFDTKNPFPNLMIKAVNGNNLAIIEVLNDQCEPCAISNTGADIFNDLDFTSTPYSRLNAQTFRYIMQQGAGDSSGYLNLMVYMVITSLPKKINNSGLIAVSKNLRCWNIYFNMVMTSTKWLAKKRIQRFQMQQLLMMKKW